MLSVSEKAHLQFIQAYLDYIRFLKLTNYIIKFWPLHIDHILCKFAQ